MTTGELCDWIREIIEKNNLKELVFIWDEFSEYFENNMHHLTGFQQVAELAATLSGDEKTGAEIILKALEAPLFHIANNAGLEGAVIINKVRESEVGTGYDALNDKYVNMVDAGILDPAKVTRSALQNATSVASTLLTTEAVVTTIKEDAPAMPAGAAGMGGMM